MDHADLMSEVCCFAHRMLYSMHIPQACTAGNCMKRATPCLQTQARISSVQSTAKVISSLRQICCYCITFGDPKHRIAMLALLIIGRGDLWRSAAYMTPTMLGNK